MRKKRIVVIIHTGMKIALGNRAIALKIGKFGGRGFFLLFFFRMRRHVYKAREKEPAKKTALCTRYNKMPHFTLCIKFDFHKSFSDTREEHDLESGNLSSTTDSEIPPSRASLWSSHRSQDGTWEYFSTCGLWAPLESSHETESRCRGGEPSK